MAWIEESELPDVPAIFQAMSLKPEALDVVKRLNEVLSFGNSGLTRTQEEGIATVVSVANRCRYVAMTHAGFLRCHSKNLEMASHFLCDYTQAPLSSTDRRILDFAVQVTQQPGDLTEDDVDQLRDVGLDESQIPAVVLIACLSNFMDRLANSLGVDLEPRYRRALENWLTGPAAQQDWLMPLQVKPPADAPKKATFGKSNGNVPHKEDSPKGTTALPEEEPDDSLLQADDFLSDLEDIINSSALANGSASDDETEEEDILAVPTFDEEETYGSEDSAASSSLDDQSPNAMEFPGNQTDDTADASVEQDGDGEDTSNEPRQSEATEEEEEPDPLINVEPLIIRFVAECCKTDNEQSATARELYIAYLRWCDEYDKHPLRQRDFGMNLSGMGFLRQRRARGRHWWVGIAVTPKEEWVINNERLSSRTTR